MRRRIKAKATGEGPNGETNEMQCSARHQADGPTQQKLSKLNTDKISVPTTVLSRLCRMCVTMDRKDCNAMLVCLE